MATDVCQAFRLSDLDGLSLDQLTAAALNRIMPSGDDDQVSDAATPPLGQVFKSMRLRLRLSLRVAADELKKDGVARISDTYLYQIEEGKVPPPHDFWAQYMHTLTRIHIEDRIALGLQERPKSD